MPVVEERYDQNKIESLKRYLKREADKGRTRDYEIIVDGFKVVSRTNDVEEFDDYDDEIRDNTRNISILIYDGPGTNRNTRYSFALNPDGANNPIPAKPVNGLGSLGEIDEIIQQRLEEKDKDYKIAALEKELAEIQGEKTEAETYIEQLQDEILQLKEAVAAKPKPSPLGMTAAEWGAATLDILLKKNIPQLAGFLNGIPQLPETAKDKAEEPAGEATFTKQGDTRSEPQLTEQQKNHLRNMELMQTAFNTEQYQIVVAILQRLMEETEQVIPVARFLNLHNN